LITNVSLRGALLPSERLALRRAASLLQQELCCECIVAHAARDPKCARICVEDWSHEAADALGFDRLIHSLEARGDFGLSLSSFDWARSTQPALSLLTRYQRLLPLGTDIQPMPQLEQVLAAHRALHELSKPLVRADFEHALDTWRWLLRLCPGASASLQLAALFHDVERLVSEPDERIEHRAANYLVFKKRHAERGAELVERTLSSLDLAGEVVSRAAELVARHEQPDHDRELVLLNDADSLSFFSLNSWGYLRYFGPEQTRRKVEYTLARMSDHARSLLAFTRQPPLIGRLLFRALSAQKRARAGAR
jgi:hypothetical protein